MPGLNEIGRGHRGRWRASTTVHLQTAPAGTTEWKTIKSLALTDYSFQTELTMPAGNTLFRAQIDGDDTFLQAVSDTTYILLAAMTPLARTPRRMVPQPRLR